MNLLYLFYNDIIISLEVGKILDFIQTFLFHQPRYILFPLYLKSFCQCNMLKARMKLSKMF